MLKWLQKERGRQGGGPVKGERILIQARWNNVQNLGQVDNFITFSFFIIIAISESGLCLLVSKLLSVRHLQTKENRQHIQYEQKKMSRKLKCQGCVGSLFWLMRMRRWFVWNIFFCFVTTRFVPYVSNWNFNKHPPTSQLAYSLFICCILC